MLKVKVSVVLWCVELAQSQSFYKRSLFIDTCTMSFELYSRAFFRDYFAEALLGLCADAVPNIRLRLCRMLPHIHRTLRPSDKALQVLLENSMHTLCDNEKDRDVMTEWRKVGLLLLLQLLQHHPPYA